MISERRVLLIVASHISLKNRKKCFHVRPRFRSNGLIVVMLQRNSYTDDANSFSDSTAMNYPVFLPPLNSTIMPTQYHNAPLSTKRRASFAKSASEDANRNQTNLYCTELSKRRPIQEYQSSVIWTVIWTLQDTWWRKTLCRSQLLSPSEWISFLPSTWYSTKMSGNHMSTTRTAIRTLLRAR